MSGADGVIWQRSPNGAMAYFSFAGCAVSCAEKTPAALGH
jgi:hypothetical protein